MAAKLSIAKKLFNLEKSKILNSSSFKNFLSENEVGISRSVTQQFVFIMLQLLYF